MLDRRLGFIVAAVAALASCRGGCARKAPDTRDALAFLPAEVAMVMVVDVAKLRAAPVMASIERADSSKLIAASKGMFDDLVRRTGFDPVHDVDTIVVATAASENAGGAVVRGRHLELTRLHAFLAGLRPESAPELQVASAKHGSRTLWSIRGRKEAAVFVDDGTLLIGYGDWAEKMADLADGVGSARALASTDLVSVLRRASGHTIGGIASNPDFLTPFLQSVEALDPAAAAGGELGGLKFRHAAWTVDVDDRLRATLNAELANPADADALTRKLKGRKLDAILRAQVDGATVRIDGQLDGESLRTAVTGFLPFLISNLAPR